MVELGVYYTSQVLCSFATVHCLWRAVEKLLVLLWYVLLSQLCGSDGHRSAEPCNVLMTAAAGKQ